MKSDKAMARRHPVPLRIGVVGCGGIVERIHLPSLARLAPNVVVSAIADPAEHRRRLIAARLGLPDNAVFADHRMLLASGLIDIVLIATPHHLHEAALCDASDSGVVIVCEKPLVPDIGLARSVVERLASSDATCTVVHNFLHAPGTARALAHLMSISGTPPYLGRASSSFAKPAPMDSSDWRSRIETGGGALNDTCYHELYLIEAMMGSPATQVSAHVRNVLHQISADDFVSLTLQHANGALSTVQTCWAAAAEVPVLCEVHSQNGAIRVESRGKRLLLYSNATRTWHEESLGDLSAPEVASGHAAFWRETIDALFTGRALPAPPPVALHQLAVIDAVRRSSARDGAWTEIAY